MQNEKKNRKTKLTKTVIDGANYGAQGRSNFVLWDSEVKGLGCRIAPKGTKTFILVYRNSAFKQKTLSLGRYGVLTVQQARDLALIRLAEIARGEDPVSAQKEIRDCDTLEKFSAGFLERHSKMKKKSWREDARRLRIYILPKLGQLRLHELTTAVIAKFHHEAGQRSTYEANRSLALLSVMFNEGQKWGLIGDEKRNPCRFIQKFKEESRERFLTHEEMGRIAKAIAEEQNVFAKAAIWLFLLTGLRKGELVTAKWSQVDWERRELVLPQNKSGKIQYVALSAPALEILNKLPREVGNPHILPGQKNNIKRPWERIRQRAGVPDVRLHDLRRTCGSWLAQSGISLLVIKNILRHQSIQTTQVYARLQDNQSRLALESHGQALAGLIDVTGVTDENKE